MKKVGRFIMTLVLILLLLGGIAIGVGMLTGADATRIYSVLNARYDLDSYIQTIQEAIRMYSAGL